MRRTVRPAAFLRMIANVFASAESEFVPLEWWAACEDATLHPVVTDPSMPVWIGVDASVKRDSTAIVACTWDAEAGKVRLVWHRIWQPSVAEPLDFEATVGTALRDLRRRFNVRAVLYDPYQLVALAQTLTAEGVPMEEFAQTTPGLTTSSQNLYDLVKAGNLRAYPDDALRLAVQRCVAIEGTRGWRIAKEKAAHKIDVVVALALAAFGTVRDGTVEEWTGPVGVNMADAPRETVYDPMRHDLLGETVPSLRGRGFPDFCE
jgi:phage terminase large subunit-like protein